jgi:3-oxoacid CoA-transferase
MDLVAGARRVIAVMEHCARDGSPKLLRSCTLPVTGKDVVKMIITDLCVFDLKERGGLVLRELNAGVTVEEVRAKTECGFAVGISTP